MNLRKQPGCWLRSSHPFKECVIAHWSSEFARKITGAKLYTEIVDLRVPNNVHYKSEEEVVYIVRHSQVVEEHSIVERS